MLTALLPEGMGADVFGMLLASSFFASFITVAFGLGGGVLLLAVFAALLPPAALIPVHGVIQIGSNLSRVIVLFKHIHWSALPAFAIGSVIGAALGGAVVVNLPPGVVQIVVGGFIIYSVFAHSPTLLSRLGFLVGAVSSFLTMFFGASGIFVANFTKSFHLERHSHVGTHGALMVFQHGIKSLTFAVLGFAFGPWIFFMIVMVAAGFIGTLCGRGILTRMSNERFKLVLNVLLIVISARLIWSGVTSLTGL